MHARKLIGQGAAAFTAQGVSAAVSALSVLLLAGSLDAGEYGLWQLYTLAGSFSGLLQLGLCDGVYLRIGGMRAVELDRRALGSQFRHMLVLQTALALAAAIPTAFSGVGRSFSLCAAFLYMPLFNAAAYLGYILQATGRTSLYSFSTMIDRASFIVLVGVTAFSGNARVWTFIAASITAKLISLGFFVLVTRDIVFAPRAAGGVARQSISDISRGSKLLFANLAGQLTLSAARIAVILRWGDAEFGRISFVITLSSLMLRFAAQLGMVIFPSLRREASDSRMRIFDKINSAAVLFLPMSFFLYIPLKYAVGMWLPEYAPRMDYLAILMPLCVFEGRTQLVNSTFMKVMGDEARLLRVNLISAGVSTVLCVCAAFLFGSMPAVLSCAVTAAALRCFISDMRIHKKERGAAVADLLSQCAICAVFVASASLLTDIAGMVAFAAFYAWFIYTRRAELAALIPTRRIIKQQ